MSLLKLNEEQRKWLKQFNIEESLWLTLVNSIFPGAKPESIVMAVQYCKARNLDVLMKPVHIVPMPVTVKGETYKDDKTVYRDVVMPGIYTHRITASRSKGYAGQDAPVFGEVKKFEIGGLPIEAPEYCTVTVYRMLEGQRVPFSHTEFFEEAVATKQNGQPNSMWVKRKRGQLSKCAEAGALRKAYPEELGGEMTAEEMINDEAVVEIPPADIKQIETISADQVTHLQDLINETGTKEEMVLTAYDLESIEGLAVEKYAEVKDMLSERLSQQQEAQA